MIQSNLYKAAVEAIILVGDPGSGKTRLATAFPRPGILDNDGNLASALRVYDGPPFPIAEGFRRDDGTEVPDDQRWLHATTQAKALLASKDVDTFVLDGLSNIARWGLIYAESQLKAAGIDVRKEYLAKYNSFIPLFSNFITMLRIPKKRVVVTVHQTTDKDEFGRMRYYLDIPGRLSETLTGQFTDAWGLYATPDPSNAKVGAKYEIRTKPSGYHPNLKTSLDLEPAINITSLTPKEIWALLSPKLSINTK